MPKTALAGDWMEIEDPKSGKTYWYNAKTQKTSDTNPEAAGGTCLF